MKFVKVMFDNTSGAKKDFEYKLGEVNISNNWNPSATSGKDFGGFNYTTEDCILRWLHRGDTIYDVEVPHDAENIKLEGATTIWRTNKIIVSNPRKVTDNMALEFYKISNIPDLAYPNALGAVAVMGYEKTAKAILEERVNVNNIDMYLNDWDDFISKHNRKDLNDVVKYVDRKLNEIKNNK